MTARQPLRAAAVALLLLLSLLDVGASEAQPYLGSWSNGRGETLVITEKTVQFGSDKAVLYRDITRATDGASFELQITAKGDVNGFGGKFLGITIEGDSMKMITYRSHGDYMGESDPQSEVTWFRDEEE